MCSIAASAQAVVQTLLGDAVPQLSQHRRALKSSAMSDIRRVVFAHRNLWRCLGVFQFNDNDDKKLRDEGEDTDENVLTDVDDELWERAEAALNRIRMKRKREFEEDTKKPEIRKWRGRISRRPWGVQFHALSTIMQRR